MNRFSALLLVGLLMLGACRVAPTVTVEVPPFDQVLAPEIHLIVGVYPEGEDKGVKASMIFIKVDSYRLFTDGNQTWLTIVRGVTTQMYEIKFKSFTILVEMRDKNRPRID